MKLPLPTYDSSKLLMPAPKHEPAPRSGTPQAPKTVVERLPLEIWSENILSRLSLTDLRAVARTGRAFYDVAKVAWMHQIPSAHRATIRAAAPQAGDAFHAAYASSMKALKSSGQWGELAAKVCEKAPETWNIFEVETTASAWLASEAAHGNKANAEFALGRVFKAIASDCPVEGSIVKLNNKGLRTQPPFLNRAPHLKEVYLWGNQLTHFDTTGLEGLKELYLDQNQLTTLDVSGVPNLEILAVSENQLTTLDASPLQNIEGINLMGNPISAEEQQRIIAQLPASLEDSPFTT